MTGQRGYSRARSEKPLPSRYSRTEKEISERLDKRPDILKEDDYIDVQAFMAAYREAETVVEQYNRNLAEWKGQVKEKSRPQKPSEKESV